jgi:hypothetical protein
MNPWSVRLNALQPVPWAEVKYRRIDFSHEGIVRYRDILRSHFSGPVEFAAFQAIDMAKFRAAYGILGPSKGAVESVLLSDAVRDTFAPTGSLVENPLSDSVQINSKLRFEFEGLLADILNLGGIYGDGWSAQDKVQPVAAECVAGIRTLDPTGSRYWWRWQVVGPWSSFFCDVDCDHTFLVLFPKPARWFVLCTTDTD